MKRISMPPIKNIHLAKIDQQSKPVSQKDNTVINSSFNKNHHYHQNLQFQSKNINRE
jgi:hypothetical protein